MVISRLSGPRVVLAVTVLSYRLPFMHASKFDTFALYSIQTTLGGWNRYYLVVEYSVVCGRLHPFWTMLKNLRRQLEPTLVQSIHQPAELEPAAVRFTTE